MSLVADIIAIVLAAVFLTVGIAKLAAADNVVEEFERFGYPGWFRAFTGACEVAGAALLLIGIASQALGLVGGALLLVVMVSAIATHLRVGDGADKLAPPVLLLALTVVEIAFRVAG